MPNIIQYKESMLDIIYTDEIRVMGECNCPKCLEDKRRKMIQDLATKIYPELTFLPHMMDAQLPFYGRSSPWRNSTGKDLDNMILQALDELRTEDRRRVGQYKRYNRDYEYCRDCGRATTTWHKVQSMYRHIVKKYHVCPMCHARYQRCIECNIDWHYESGKRRCPDHSLGSKVWVCNKCYQKDWGQCYNCHNDKHRKDMQKYDPSGQFHDYWQYLNEFKWICLDCLMEAGDMCECCDRELYSWEGQEHGDYECLCSSCYEGCQIIHAWEWKPTPIIQVSQKNPKLVKDKLLYGVELEIEKTAHSNTLRYQMAHAILENVDDGYLYIKEDATITDGVEIVTHPFSWQDYRERREVWGEMFDLIREYGYGADTYDSVGMHVHMSKNAFTHLHLYKFLNFIYAMPHRNFIGSIAQRMDHDYAMFCSMDTNNTKRFAKNKANCSEERHSAINLTGEDTVEVRIFASTIQLPLFNKNLEFLQSLYEFTRNSKVSHITIPQYWVYLNNNNNKNRFRDLITFIGENPEIKSDYSLFGNSKQEVI
jgi:hypothetical protein